MWIGNMKTNCDLKHGMICIICETGVYSLEECEFMIKYKEKEEKLEHLEHLVCSECKEGFLTEDSNERLKIQFLKLKKEQI